MNKLMIVLLAICFISCVNAFVKRDTEPSKVYDDIVEQVKKQFGAAQKTLEEAVKSIDTDAFKKMANEALDVIKNNVGEAQKKIDESPKN